MEGGLGSESGVLAPFLTKTYEIVDDSSTNNIVSWSPTNDSFIVWNAADFCRFLLPKYFKHNNFSSFIRQLNIYGFRKVNEERWEFCNDNFVRDKIHLLKNIHRKKPASHNQNNNSPSSLIDPERATLEEQIEKLKNEKIDIESQIGSSKQNCSVAKLSLKDLLKRLDDMEKRQNNLVNFFEEALKNPNIVELINRKISALDLSEYNKKRRFSSLDNFGNVFNQDFSDKFSLMSPKKQSSYDEESLNNILFESEQLKGMLATVDPPAFTYEDIGAITGFDQSPEFFSLKPNDEKDDSHTITCLHNLTLDNVNLHDIGSEEYGGSDSPSKNNVENEVTNLILSNDQEVPSNNQGNSAPEGTMNDDFWEQFFTN